jgi:hypothetical protein
MDEWIPCMETSQERLRDADVNIDRKWARAHFLGVAVFPAVNSGLSDADLSRE